MCKINCYIKLFLIFPFYVFAKNANENYTSAIPNPDFKYAFIKMVIILSLLLVLVFFTFWLFKRFMRIKIDQANLTKNIKIIERRALSHKSILYLIEVEGKRVLISESNLEVRKIESLDSIDYENE